MIMMKYELLYENIEDRVKRMTQNVKRRKEKKTKKDVEVIDNCVSCSCVKFGGNKCNKEI